MSFVQVLLSRLGPTTLAITLAACGGGGGGDGSVPPASPPPPPPPPANVSMSGLTVSTGTLSPAFDPAVFSYTVSVPDATTSIEVTATADDNAATLRVNGVATGSGSPSAPIPTPFGLSAVDVAISNGGTSQTTIISVSRTDSTAASANILFPTAGLTDADNIQVSGTASDPDSGVTGVTVNGVTATSTDNFATWTANPIPLSGGSNSIDVAVTNGGGTTDAAAASTTIVREHLLLGPAKVKLDGNRAYVVDSVAPALYGISLDTGAVARVDTSGPGFERPDHLVLDVASSRAWVTDDVADAVFEIDTATGARQVLSARGTGSGGEIIEYYGLADDLANNRLIVSGLSGRQALIGIDLASGNRSIVNQSVGLPFDGVISPAGLTLDIANNRAFLGDTLEDAIKAADLADVTPVTTISRDGIRGIGPDIEGPLDLALDGGRIWAVDNAANALFDIDVASGDRTIVSDITTGTGPALDNPSGLDLDLANDDVLIVDSNIDAVFTVERATGNRTVLTETRRGSGRHMVEPRSLAIDTVNNRMLVWDARLFALVFIDLDSGDRSVFVDLTSGNLATIYGLAIDLASNRAFFVLSSEQRIMSADLDTGMIQVFSGNNAGIGPDLFFPEDVVLDAANQRLLVTGVEFGSYVMAVDLATGDRSIVSQLSVVGTGPAFSSIQGIALDTSLSRVLVVNETNESVMAVDLATGDRSILSDATTGTGVEFRRPEGIAYDASRDLAYVTDDLLDAIVEVDLATGNRSILSDASTGRGPLYLPFDVAIDPTSGRLFTVDQGASSLAEVDTASGDSVIISK